jgi:hypothetical protein
VRCFRWAPILLLASLATACSSVKEHWVESTYGNITFPSLYNVVLTTVDAEGYPVRNRNPGEGRIESEWVYGTSQRVVRGPSRRKVIAEIEPQPGDLLLVRLRVAEEVVRKGGMTAVNVRESEDWEPFEDNFDDAEYLMAKVAALLNENRVTLPAPADGGHGNRP